MFSDRERKIFVYFVAGQERFADPFAVTRRLVRWLGGDPDRVCADRYAGWPEARYDEDGKVLPTDPAEVDKALEPVRFEAEEQIIRAARQAFGLPEYDPATREGVPEDECLRVFDEFCVWCEGQKKSSGS